MSGRGPLFHPGTIGHASASDPNYLRQPSATAVPLGFDSPCPLAIREQLPPASGGRPTSHWPWVLLPSSEDCAHRRQRTPQLAGLTQPSAGRLEMESSPHRHRCVTPVAPVAPLAM